MFNSMFFVFSQIYVLIGCVAFLLTFRIERSDNPWESDRDNLNVPIAAAFLWPITVFCAAMTCFAIFFDMLLPIIFHLLDYTVFALSRQLYKINGHVPDALCKKTQQTIGIVVRKLTPLVADIKSTAIKGKNNEQVRTKVRDLFQSVRLHAPGEKLESRKERRIQRKKKF